MAIRSYNEVYLNEAKRHLNIRSIQLYERGVQDVNRASASTLAHRSETNSTKHGHWEL